MVKLFVCLFVTWWNHHWMVEKGIHGEIVSLFVTCWKLFVCDLVVNLPAPPSGLGFPNLLRPQLTLPLHHNWLSSLFCYACAFLFITENTIVYPEFHGYVDILCHWSAFVYFPNINLAEKDTTVAVAGYFPTPPTHQPTNIHLKLFHLIMKWSVTNFRLIALTEALFIMLYWSYIWTPAPTLDFLICLWDFCSKIKILFFHDNLLCLL